MNKGKSNAIYVSLVKVSKSGQSVQALISEAYASGNKSEIIEAADTIEQEFPTEKIDGKDANRKGRNNLLSILRMQLKRAGEALPAPVKLGLKRVEGTWQIVEGDIKAEEEKQEESKGEGEEQTADALWLAVETVVAALPTNKAVRLAIKEALAKLD